MSRQARMLIAVSLLLFSSSVFCAERASPGLSPRVYRALDEALELVEQGQTAAAIKRLESLRESTASNSYDRAVIDQQLGYAFIEQGQMRRASEHLREALNNPVLPQGDRLSLLYTQVQVLVEADALSEARTLADELISLDPSDPEYLAISAYIAYQRQDYSRALDEILKAIKGSAEPRESWLQIATNIYIAREDWESAQGFVRDLIERAPAKQEYWLYLIELSLRNDDTKAALRAMVLAHQQGVLPPAQLRTLAQLWAQYGAPERGARLLQGWMSEGVLPTDAGLLELRGNFWLMARETGHAIDDLRQAAGLENSARLHQIAGEVAFRDHRWSLAAESLAAALASGQLKDPNRVRLLLGVAAYYAGDERQARDALTPLLQIPEQREQARYWLGKL